LSGKPAGKKYVAKVKGIRYKVQGLNFSPQTFFYEFSYYCFPLNAGTGTFGENMANDNLPGFISALLHSDIYDHPAENIQLVQTHISFVLLAGEFVYKFKKPVDFGFLDFSTLEKRQYCCEQELLLNRRLCPDIYLGLVTITSEGDGFALNGNGAVVEYGVKMVRMPEDRMMVNLIRKGQVDREQIDALVDVLVPFYQQADRSAEIDGFGTAESVAVNVLENFEQTKGFIGGGAVSQEQFDRISGWAEKFLSQEQLFSDRIRGGYIRDCHGDLYSANICLADNVYIYDCIEFNRRFRYCDVASDIAFLAMDLDFHGLQELSEYCIAQFCERSGDTGLKEMLNFYKCYRAYVRGKIGLFTAGDPAVDEAVKKSSMEAAAKYFKLAESYL
jgi:aminoglycoside phosphotransferase family enzyme